MQAWGLCIASVLGAGVVSLLVLIQGAEAAVPDRGYQPRLCGLDMDRDGLIGEPENCTVCNGDPANTDPDGDDVNEDIVYVSCPAGPYAPASDVTGGGSHGNPYASIQHAFDVVAARVNGTAEAIVCFRNICREENLSPQAPGIDDYYEVPATGSEARDWRFPRNPGMLIGWDVDGGRTVPGDAWT